MLSLKPFCALRPKKEFCPKVASVPYDVVSRAEASALARGNPLSFLHVSRSEIDLPPATDPYSAEVYQKAAANFKDLQERGILIRDPQPCFYVYLLKRNARCQHGIVACCSAADYERNIIKKHEKTRIDKEEDRTKHTAALRAHSGPVFLTYRDSPGIDGLTTAAEKQEPLYDFTAPDGIQHTVWQINDYKPVADAFRNVPAAYIADGHHRAAAGVRVARELGRISISSSTTDRARSSRSTNGAEGGRRPPGGVSNGFEIFKFDPDKEYNWFLAVLFPASQLEILPYNRCVHDLGGANAASFLEEVKKRFNVEENARSAPSKAGQISMYLGNKWSGLTSRTAPPANDPVARLDVSVLQSGLFEPVLGIKDPRTDKRLDFIGGIHGPQELEQRVNRGKAAVAFSMHPVTVNQLLAIADAGQIMPPKSTWFEPKLRDALLIHTF